VNERLEKILRSPKTTIIAVVVNATACAVAYKITNDLDSASKTAEWIEQTRSTTGYGNYPATNETARWVSVYTMSSNFFLTLSLAADFVNWKLPGSWTHEEAEETEAKINAICRALNIDPDHIEREIN
jgi:hypothetical protein